MLLLADANHHNPDLAIPYLRDDTVVAHPVLQILTWLVAGERSPTARRRPLAGLDARNDALSQEQVLENLEVIFDRLLNVERLRTSGLLGQSREACSFGREKHHALWITLMETHRLQTIPDTAADARAGLARTPASASSTQGVPSEGRSVSFNNRRPSSGNR